MKLCEHCLYSTFPFKISFFDTYDVFVFLRGDILHDYLKLYKYIFNLHISKALRKNLTVSKFEGPASL